ncbi:Fe-S protein assembly co-chaperone HscB [Parasediminibacterium sp. JCM 36343]|uniref:Fe-S protein assembly co-chaperone HscB n=1 Tax=Parasediminibacterium sp. JCM 36343 TaxID=3374279 RepID=UPI0039781CCF
MNYFELFNIPVNLLVDTLALKKQFYVLSRKFHPDFFSTASAEEQEDALQKSAMLNKALKVFSSPDETIKYVLQLKGLLEDDEKYQLPPAFLMDVMEVNEQLADAKMDGSEQQITTLKLEIEALQKKLYEPVKNIVEGYKDGITTEKELLQIKNYYFQKKYIDRMLGNFEF